MGPGGASASDTVTLYMDGAVEASTASNVPSYVAMENLAAEVAFGINTVPNNNLFVGDAAAGPLGPFYTQKELSAVEVLLLYEKGLEMLDLP